jgi:outer membrane protein assembly factor BamB
MSFFSQSVTGVSLEHGAVGLEVGTTEQLSVLTEPEGLIDVDVVWTSSVPSVATVSEDGLVEAKTAGVTVIQVATADGNHAASCQITVNGGDQLILDGQIGGEYGGSSTFVAPAGFTLGLYAGISDELLTQDSDGGEAFMLTTGPPVQTGSFQPASQAFPGVTVSDSDAQVAVAFLADTMGAYTAYYGRLVDNDTSEFATMVYVDRDLTVDGTADGSGGALLGNGTFNVLNLSAGWNVVHSRYDMTAGDFSFFDGPLPLGMEYWVGSSSAEPTPDGGTTNGDGSSDAGPGAGTFAASGTIRGQAVSITSENLRVSSYLDESFNPGASRVRILASHGGYDTGIEIEYTAVLEGRTYYDHDLDFSSIVRFCLLSDLTTEYEGHWGYGSDTGSLTITQYDGTRLAGTFDIVSYLGDTLTGSFDIPFSPSDDPGFGTDGTEPVSQPTGGSGGDTSGDNTTGNTVSVSGTIRTVPVSISSGEPAVSTSSDSGDSSVEVTVSDADHYVSFRFVYTNLLEGQTYVDSWLAQGGAASMVVASDIIQAAEGYSGNLVESGTLTIDRYDGQRLTGSFDVVTNIGDTVRGSFDIAFSPSDDPNYGADGEVCTDSPSSSRILWTYETGSDVRSSPALSPDGTVLFGSDDGYLYAVDGTGALLWRTSLGAGVICAPVIDSDGAVYIGTLTGELYQVTVDSASLDVTTSRFPDGPFGGKVSATPAIAQDGTLVHGGHDSNVYAFNDDKTVAWNTSTGMSIDSSPAIGDDGSIYVGNYDGKLYALSSAGELKWSYIVGSDCWSSPAMATDGTVYIASGSGTLAAVGPGGAESWRFTLGDGSYANPTIGTDGTVFVGDFAGNFYAISPNGTELWRFQADSGIRTAALIGDDGTIYVASLNGLYALDADGNQLWWEDLGTIESNPVMDSDGTLYVGSNDNNLYAVATDSSGLAASPWPMFHADSKHTGRAPVSR